MPSSPNPYQIQPQPPMKFEKEIDFILSETNAYIPRFVTRTDKLAKREKRAILAALFTIGSGLFSAWRFYKDYTFKRNLRRTLHHIINDGEHFRQGILSNRRNLVSLADITASNFKLLREKFEGLRNMTFEPPLPTKSNASLPKFNPSFKVNPGEGGRHMLEVCLIIQGLCHDNKNSF